MTIEYPDLTVTELIGFFEACSASEKRNKKKLTKEEIIDYILSLLQDRNILNTLDDENFYTKINALINDYELIQKMAFDKLTMTRFDAIVKQSLLIGKKENFTNFPHQNIFIQFYSAFTELVADLVLE
jgi:hypothetical protein